MKVKYLFILFFILINSVNAVNYDLYTIETDLENNKASFIIEATGTFNNEILSFNLPPSVEKLEVYVDGISVNCMEKEVIGSTVIDCLRLNEIHSVIATFKTSYPIIDLDKQKLFNFGYQVNSDVFFMTIKLPVGYIINDDRLITPDPSRIYSDGRRIIVEFREDNFKDKFDLSLIYESIKNENNINYFFLLGGLLIISAYLFLSHKKLIKRGVDISLSQALLENEKKVINALSNAKGHKLWQKELQFRSKLSKVKLSRLLKSLEKRGLIEKEPYGASNIIHLKDKK